MSWFQKTTAELLEEADERRKAAAKAVETERPAGAWPLLRPCSPLPPRFEGEDALPLEGEAEDHPS